MKKYIRNVSRQAIALKKIRKKHFTSQKAFAMFIGYDTSQFISNMERGKAPVPFSVLASLKPHNIDTSKLKKAIIDDYREQIEGL